MKQDLFDFIEILPDWESIAIGLNAVVLSAGDYNCMGWHSKGVVGIAAWEQEIEWEDCHQDFYEDHKDIWDKLNVPCIEKKEGYTIRFDRNSAKAFQLIHIFVHELGHHHDRMTTKSKRSAARGECYAESYAKKYEDAIIEAYMKIFKL